MNWRDWLASGGAAPRLVLCVGVVGAALAARAIFGEPNRPPRSGARAAAAQSHEDAPVVRGPQVQILGGPKTRDASADGQRSGDAPSATKLESDRRRAELSEVLGRLDGAPVWVEGIDGPAPVEGDAGRGR